MAKLHQCGVCKLRFGSKNAFLMHEAAKHPEGAEHIKLTREQMLASEAAEIAQRRKEKRARQEAKRAKTSRPAKAKNQFGLTVAYLDAKAARLKAGGYPVSKWILFAKELLRDGFSLELYEAKSTVSKYVYVSKPGIGAHFKVRFSNHRPNARKEDAGDCDFFVGVSNKTVTTTDDALAAVRKFFSEKETLNVG